VLISFNMLFGTTDSSN